MDKNTSSHIAGLESVGHHAEHSRWYIWAVPSSVLKKESFWLLEKEA